MSHSIVVDRRLTGVPKLGELAPIGVRQEPRKRDILIIYPDAGGLGLFAYYCQRLRLAHDMVPQYAMSSEEGLLYLRRQDFDLVLLSTESRRHSLESMTQRIKAASRNPSVALVGIRFPELGEGRKQHLRAGFTDFLAAPPSFGEFARVVGDCLTEPENGAKPQDSPQTPIRILEKRNSRRYLEAGKCLSSPSPVRMLTIVRERLSPKPRPDREYASP